jgi:hypothetical protein
MSARRDPQLVEIETRERQRNRGGARGPFPVASSATTKIPTVTARWVNTDRTHVWWRCQFCGVRHVYALPARGRLHTSCGNLVSVQVVDW